ARGAAGRGTVSCIQRLGAGGRRRSPSPEGDAAVFGRRNAGVLLHGRGFGNRIGGRSGGGGLIRTGNGKRETRWATHPTFPVSRFPYPGCATSSRPTPALRFPSTARLPTLPHPP